MPKEFAAQRIRCSKNSLLKEITLKEFSVKDITLKEFNVKEFIVTICYDTVARPCEGGQTGQS